MANSSNYYIATAPSVPRNDKQYESIRQMQGSMSQQATNDPLSMRRTNYIKELNSYKNLP